MTTELQVTGSDALEFTGEQRQMIRDTFANGCSDSEFAVLIEIARVRRLNPLLRQIHFVSRWDSQKSRSVWATQVSIDGLRAIAQRTGLYDGQDEPEFVENPDGSLKLCKVRVYRKDWSGRPAVGVAYWNEYVQTMRDKQTGKERPTAMWARMPHVMLAKVSEAIALRKAFPEDMSGLYTGDEMAQADSEHATPEPAASTQSRARAARAPIVAESTVVAPAALPAPTTQTDAPPPVTETRAAETGLSPASQLRLDLLEQSGRCDSAEAVRDLWLTARADVARVITDKDERAIVWTALAKRVAALRGTDDAAGKAWLTSAVAPSQPPATTAPTAPTTAPVTVDATVASTPAADDWRATPETMDAHVETLAGYDEVIACARTEWGVVGLAPLLKRRLMVVAMMGEDAANNEVNVAMRKAREAAQRGPHDDGPTLGGGAAGGSQGSATRATGNGARATGGAHASPRAQLSAFAAHIAAKPRARDPQDVKARTQTASEVAMSYLKRREDFVAAGIADGALDAVRDELRSRGVVDTDAFLAGVIAHMTARRRTPNTTEHRAADRMAA